MNRFYKLGKCNWCNNVKEVFLTTFESETNKLMCTRCRDFINHQRLMRDGIEDAVDLWDETAPGINLSKSTNINLPKDTKFVIRKSSIGNVILYGYKNEDRFVVDVFNPRSLNLNKHRLWEYTHLGPAVRRFNIESFNVEGG